MDVQELFGQNLKRCRKRAGITQRALSVKIGLSESAVWNMEAGTLFASDEILDHITTALGILPEELFYTGTEHAPEAVHADVVKKVAATHIKYAARLIEEGIGV
jgi:transcriptional regulator with XRE-family HTH domain